ncbi:MAG: hypothetical protein ONB06_12250, partial [candidate division KSB1 bacterium]|nr:hypothetical protein [candidate division KSB1 bacterium]
HIFYLGPALPQPPDFLVERKWIVLANQPPCLQHYDIGPDALLVHLRYERVPILYDDNIVAHAVVIETCRSTLTGPNLFDRLRHIHGDREWLVVPMGLLHEKELKALAERCEEWRWGLMGVGEWHEWGVQVRGCKLLQPCTGESFSGTALKSYREYQAIKHTIAQTLGMTVG